MKSIVWSVFALFIVLPLHGQGLTVTMKETGPAGQTAPILQTDRTHARLDIPSLASQLLYDSATKTLRAIVPLVKVYREYTPATVQALAAAAAANGRGQPVPVRATYKRTGASKVGDWPCTTYDGFRGSEKVYEVCAAEGSSFGLTAADFAIVQQAIDLARTVAPPETIERIPVYGSVQSQGFAGFPVRRVSFRNGQPETTTELVGFRREAVPAAAFETPSGFNKVP
jgi:hypothetical protein